MEGMHTDDDAFLYIRNHPLKRESPQIIDVYPTILSLMRVSPDEDVDGISLIS
jgi:arylsulfatase A-like enzyme